MNLMINSTSKLPHIRHFNAYWAVFTTAIDLFIYDTLNVTTLHISFMHWLRYHQDG